jgi:hypothetical protein
MSTVSSPCLISLPGEVPPYVVRQIVFLVVDANMFCCVRVNPNLDPSMTTVEGLRWLSLPTEILAMICADEELSANDLAAMRLLNREIHAVVTLEFAQRYFQDPFVMMMRDSLEKLVEICKHPVFGPHVRKIQLLNNYFNPESLRSLVHDVENAYQDPDVTKMMSGKRHLQCHTDLLVEQYDLLRSGAGPELLKQAFEILGAQRGSVIVASQKFRQSYQPIGWVNIARNFDKDRIHTILGMPRVISTIKILLRTAQAGACTVSKLEIGVDCFQFDVGERTPNHGIDGTLLLGLQEFTFQFEWLNQYASHNALAYQHLVSLMHIMPRDLKVLTVCSDAVVSGANAESRAIPYSFVAGLRSDLFTTMQPDALETLHLSKLLLHQYNLLRFLEAQRSSLKKLVIEELHRSGDWDQVLSHIAETFSLEHFSLRKALKLIGTRRDRYQGFSAKIVSWYSENCEVKEKDGMRQEINMFIESQETERRAKEAETQVQVQRPPRTEASQPRRSKRIARKSTSED